MRDRDIDDALRKAGEAKPGVDRVLVDRIAKSLGSGLQPVSVLPPSWLLTGGLMLISGILALAGGWWLGLFGIRRMTLGESGLVFPALAILVWLASALCVAEAIPGSRRLVAPWVLAVSSCLGIAAVFTALFHDYGTSRFVSQGVKCLVAGLAEALPVSLAIWLALRRGFAVNPAAAGFVRGTLAGLAGITMLELHCPNFEVLHLMVWHIAVLPISGAIGMAAAWTVHRRRG